MFKIEEGPGLDKEVANVFGMEHGPMDCLSGIPWSPSTNLHIAIGAAESLSDSFVLVKDEASEGMWECKLNPDNRPENWSRAKTPALAICAAILKFKESQDEGV